MTVRFLGSVAFRDTPPDRRVAQTLERPARRSTDLSPVLRRFAEEASKGHGLSTSASRARAGYVRRLS